MWWEGVERWWEGEERWSREQGHLACLRALRRPLAAILAREHQSLKEG